MDVICELAKSSRSSGVACGFTRFSSQVERSMGLFTFISALPLFGEFAGYTFLNLKVVPWLKASRFYEPDANLARYHLVPHSSSFNRSFDLATTFDWLRLHYAPWNDTTREFVVFNFCDLLTDCDHFHVPFDLLPSAYSPLSRDRRYMLVGWNGLSDGHDSCNSHYCMNCFQKGRDVQLPTAENACGPYCGSDRATLLANAVWNSHSPRKMLTALQYTQLWEERKHTVFWAGRVTGSIGADISGRFLVRAECHSSSRPSSFSALTRAPPSPRQFHELYSKKDGWFIRSTFDFAKGQPAPLSTPVLEFMRNSTFCYSPLGGIGGDTDRYLPAILSGCIPIMLRTVRRGGELLRLMFPFEELFDWSRFSVVIDYDDLPKLPQILSRVDIHSKRANAYAVWRHLLYTSVYGSYLGEDSSQDVLNTLMKILEDRPTPPARAEAATCIK